MARIADVCYCLEIRFHVLASLSLLQSFVDPKKLLVEKISTNWSLINGYDLTIGYLEKTAPAATSIIQNNNQVTIYFYLKYIIKLFFTIFIN